MGAFLLIDSFPLRNLLIKSLLKLIGSITCEFGAF